ncbi:hypothetical protein C2S53_004532 [Perilla frutescens var. hirtella]|uniref:Peptidase metallopeptidase domain-containing protein n=1 Tax=Perilla frutescens var. hirtella TaxID=608512 RepID=A0AAD4P2J4_PERFH|nr:hypothetical protein C2S53_004532 [Perilla frutescens var. hirtella]
MPTGTLDAETISQMKTPRCGVPDIINGTNYMQPRRKNNTRESSSHYAFFSNNRVFKWDKFNLTYKLLGADFPEFAKLPIEVALEKWGDVSEFIFSEEKRDFVGGDVNIGFYRGDHGDGFSFDGRGGVLAHAYAPSDGRLHFDLDEDWFSDYPKSLDSHSIDTVALHEIGHILGLGHSAQHAAVMYPTIRPRQIKIALDADDIEGIQELYDFDY